MSHNFKYIPGDHWVQCQVCGFEYRNSQMRKRWDGVITCKMDWEPRHPQDFVRATPENTTANGFINPSNDNVITGTLGYVSECYWDGGYTESDPLCFEEF